MDEAKRQISDAKDLPNEFQIRIQIESRYLNVLLIELVPSVTVFFRSAVLKVSEGVSPGATKGWYCMCQTVSAEVLCGSVLSAFECPDGRAQGLYGSWSQAIDFWHWTSCTGLPINEVTRTSAMRAMCCNSQWLRASLLLADLPVSGISSPAVSSLCAMILTELEHEAHLDASHMSLISRMSRSCELYLGHSIKSPADLE